MKPEKTFRECKLSWLERTFGLDQVKQLPSLNSWLSEKADIDDFERKNLMKLQELLEFNVRDWYEGELDSYFIGPVMTFVNFSNKKSNLFSDRIIDAFVDDWRLYGRPDSFWHPDAENLKFLFSLFKNIRK